MLSNSRPDSRGMFSKDYCDIVYVITEIMYASLIGARRLAIFSSFLPFVLITLTLVMCLSTTENSLRFESVYDADVLQREARVSATYYSAKLLKYLIGISHWHCVN